MHDCPKVCIVIPIIPTYRVRTTKTGKRSFLKSNHGDSQMQPSGHNGSRPFALLFDVSFRNSYIGLPLNVIGQHVVQSGLSEAY